MKGVLVMAKKKPKTKKTKWLPLVQFTNIEQLDKFIQVYGDDKFIYIDNNRKYHITICPSDSSENRLDVTNFASPMDIEQYLKNNFKLTDIEGDLGCFCYEYDGVRKDKLYYFLDYLVKSGRLYYDID